MEQVVVLIVEDDPMIAFDVEETLIEAGYLVCGVAASENEALDLAEQHQPAFAVVDVSLSPGDGRNVARELCRRGRIGVLFATALCHEIRELTKTGAIGCLPKPFDPVDVPRALRAVAAIMDGDPPGRLPDHMITLTQAA
jgi:DNA-binding response OmpR family regulator